VGPEYPGEGAVIILTAGSVFINWNQTSSYFGKRLLIKLIMMKELLRQIFLGQQIKSASPD
jgi:hypothetical protein